MMNGIDEFVHRCVMLAPQLGDRPCGAADGHRKWGCFSTVRVSWPDVRRESRTCPGVSRVPVTSRMGNARAESGSGRWAREVRPLMDHDRLVSSRGYDGCRWCPGHWGAMEKWMGGSCLIRCRMDALIPWLGTIARSVGRGLVLRNLQTCHKRREVSASSELRQDSSTGYSWLVYRAK